MSLFYFWKKKRYRRCYRTLCATSELDVFSKKFTDKKFQKRNLPGRLKETVVAKLAAAAMVQAVDRQLPSIVVVVNPCIAQRKFSKSVHT